VAGGTGTIGVPLVKKLVSLGANVSVVSNDNYERVKNVFKGININYWYGDLTSYETCSNATMNQDYVFNMVCVKGNTQIQNASVATTFIPLLLVDTLLMKAALNNNIERYMFTGSICSYPNIPVRQEDSLWDGLPQANDRFAGIAKRVGEAQGEAYKLQYGWEATRVVRLSNVYGPWDDFDPKTAHVIPSLISRVVNGENPLKVAGDGSAQRDFIFVEDAVDGIITSMEKAPPCVPINLGSGKGISIKNIATTICDAVDEDIKIEWETNKPTGDLVRILDTDRSKRIINFEPIVNLNQGIRKTIEWYKNNKQVADVRGVELHGK